MAILLDKWSKKSSSFDELNFIRNKPARKITPGATHAGTGCEEYSDVQLLVFSTTAFFDGVVERNMDQAEN